MKKPIISCILFCLILLPIQGQEINTAKIDSFLNHIEKYNQGIGSVTISKGEKTVYTRRFGQNNLNRKQNGEAFKYRIGSITKLMTATLVEQLVEQGRLSLTETFLKPMFKVQPKCRTGKFKKTFTHQDLLENMG